MLPKSLTKWIAAAFGVFAALSIGAAGYGSLFDASSATGTDRYASPNGRRLGAGTISDPWDLTSALSQSSGVHPGDTLWLRGGTYSGSYTSWLSGTSAAPITVRQYPGERATLDGRGTGAPVLSVAGPYVTFWGFEVTNSEPLRPAVRDGRPEGVDVRAANTRLINLAIHDAGQGVGLWTEAPDSEMTGCLVYNNGTTIYDHGIYTQNAYGTKRIRENVILNNYGFGIHAYGSASASLVNFEISGNASFHNGSIGSSSTMPDILVGGDSPAAGIRVFDNSTYTRPFTNTTVRIGSGTNNNDASVTNNTFAGYSTFQNWASLVVTGNRFYGSTTMIQLQAWLPLPGSWLSWNQNSYVSQEAQWQPFNLTTTSTVGLFFPGWRTATGADANSSYTKGNPTGTRVDVRPNPYERGRANIIVYNWSLSPVVYADVPSVLPVGAYYEVHSAQDFFGAPVASGIYNGAPIALPMNATSVQPPMGLPAPPTTAPEFNVFVVTLAGAAAVPTPAPTAVAPPAPTPTPAPLPPGRRAPRVVDWRG